MLRKITCAFISFAATPLQYSFLGNNSEKKNTERAREGLKFKDEANLGVLNRGFA
jgi:hypothetical protein